MKKILAADLGGTNSRFAHFRVNKERKLELAETKWLATARASSFPHLLEQLDSSGFSLSPWGADLVVIAVAGPVEQESYSSPPFISWDIDLSALPKVLEPGKTALINDFIAQAYACRSPVGETAQEILSGEINPQAAVAVIGAGTGLGKSVLIPLADKGFLALPSEGGHAHFPFVSRREHEFQEFLKEKLGEEQITGNIVVSGKGLSCLHWFLQGEKLAPEEITKKVSPGSVTLTWAARFYGRVCRNHALETLALGGLYIAGGVAARLPELVTDKEFGREFRSSTTLGHILKRIPVFLINNQDSGLWGAAFFGLQRLKEKGERNE